MFYLACDLGAESGRLMMGDLEGGKLTVHELHRFPNEPIRAGSSLHWDIPQLWAGLMDGLAQAAKLNHPWASISTDSWGLDYILFDQAGNTLPPVFHYRDMRTAQGVRRVLATVPWETIFSETGIQFMPISTIFQLATEPRERLEQAQFLLGIGDAFNYFLSGAARPEESLASTFQLYNPRERNWSDLLLEKLNLPRRLFPPIVPPGTLVGDLKPALQKVHGLSGLQVIASCSHDTGAAVAAVPAQDSNWAYISSGTWSLVGVELSEPNLTDRARELNFTNEIGHSGSVRFLKNIAGLWIVQECRRHWAEAGEIYEYAALTRMAAEAQPFASLIDPSDPRFLGPGEMPRKIAEFCRETGQQAPSAAGDFIRAALESLAFSYRRTLGEIQTVLGRKIERLHVVGGGSQNQLLNQFTADAAGIPVVAGPVEATAIGNILIQAITLGHLKSLAAGRTVVRASIPLISFSPKEPRAWDAAYQKFQQISVKK